MLAAIAVARTAPGALPVRVRAALGGARRRRRGARGRRRGGLALAPAGRGAAGRTGPGRLLLACALLLAGNVREWREAAGAPRHPDSVRAEALAQAVRTQLAVETRWPFLLRVGPGADPRVALGLILALDKAHLRFTVEPFGPYLLVGRFTPRGDEVGQLLLGDIPPTGRAKPVAVAGELPGGLAGGRAPGALSRAGDRRGQRLRGLPSSSYSKNPRPHFTPRCARPGSSSAAAGRAGT